MLIHGTPYALDVEDIRYQLVPDNAWVLYRKHVIIRLKIRKGETARGYRGIIKFLSDLK